MKTHLSGIFINNVQSSALKWRKSIRSGLIVDDTTEKVEILPRNLINQQRSS